MLIFLIFLLLNLVDQIFKILLPIHSKKIVNYQLLYVQYQMRKQHNLLY